MARTPPERRSVERAPAQGAREDGSPGGDGRAREADALLAGDSPRDVLARLVDGDPLGLEGRCRTRLGELALLLDLERLTLRTAARAAFAARHGRDGRGLEAWLDALIERAAADLVDEDRAAERLGAGLEEGQARYGFLAQAMGIELGHARRACVVFNDLPARVRRVWWLLVVERLSLHAVCQAGLGPPGRVRADLRRALLALSLLEDPGGMTIETGDDHEP